MLFELGKVLEFNKNKWGFIDYNKSKKRLTVLSLEEKEKFDFKLNESEFNRLYLKSSNNEISKETVDFVKKEELEKQELLNNLKPGVKFIGSDKKEYTFLKLKGKKIHFYDDKDSYSANSEFAKSLTGEFDNSYKDHLDVVTTKKEYNALSNEDKVKIATNYCKQCFNDEGGEFEILEIGNIISGEAYYHEVDDYYNLIGLQIKYKNRYSFQDKAETDIGFFPIYIGKTPEYYPISFEESASGSSFDTHRSYNGYGDHIELDKILVKKESLSNINFN